MNKYFNQSLNKKEEENLLRYSMALLNYCEAIAPETVYDE